MPTAATKKTRNAVRRKRQRRSPHSAMQTVVFYPLRCPHCRSTELRTYCSRPPTRWHSCRECGTRFRSNEQ